LNWKESPTGMVTGGGGGGGGLTGLASFPLGYRRSTNGISRWQKRGQREVCKDGKKLGRTIKVEKTIPGKLGGRKQRKNWSEIRGTIKHQKVASSPNTQASNRGGVTTLGYIKSTAAKNLPSWGEKTGGSTPGQ